MILCAKSIPYFKNLPVNVFVSLVGKYHLVTLFVELFLCHRQYSAPSSHHSLLESFKTRLPIGRRNIQSQGTFQPGGEGTKTDGEGK